MRWKLATCFAFLLSFVAPALADIAAIHAGALPQETPVLAALDDARRIEPFCSSWTADWKYPVAKSEVAAHLEKDLTFLRRALQNHPENVDLLLLTGLVARYSYNLDLPGAYDVATNALNSAEKLAPSDFRSLWFRATLQCQTTQTVPGAEAFLAIENSHSPDQLPAAFWDDYMECAGVTLMPAHVLRAADRAAQTHAPDSRTRTFLADTARKRFDPFDPNRKYEPKEVWEGSNASADPTFTSTLCGVRLQAHGDWSIEQLALGNGSCVANFTTGPYQATKRKLHPGILLLVQQAAPGQSLQDYLQKFLKNGTFEPFAPARCPSTTCLAMKGLQPGMYGKDGDGHGRLVVFERDQPQYPGLALESPWQAPKPDKTDAPQYFHPRQLVQRIPGKLYYLVLLDTASSIEDPALKDFDFFLEHLTVE